MPRTTRSRGRARTASIERNAVLAEDDRVAVDRRFDEIHRRRADERGDEEVSRLGVEPLRRVDLEQPPVAHDGDPLPEGHRLDLVVGDVERGDAEPVVELRQRGAHPDPELRVEVRERLVHQERLRLPRDRPAHRDALALASGELRRPPVEQLAEPEQLGHLVHSALDLLLRAYGEPSGRSRGSGGRSCAGRARRSGRPSRCRGVSAARSVTSRPPIEMLPSVASSSPATMRRSVDLPQPDGPTRTMNSPSAISSDTLSSAGPPRRTASRDWSGQLLPPRRWYSPPSGKTS